MRLLGTLAVTVVGGALVYKALGALPPANTAAVPRGLALARLPLGDQQFLQTAAAQVGIDLVAGRLALQRARQPGLRAYAQRRLDTIERLDADLRALAAANAVPLRVPQADDASQQQLQALSRAEGEAFDREYRERFAQRHARDLLTVFEKPWQLRDPEVQRLVTRALPALRAQMLEADGLPPR